MAKAIVTQERVFEVAQALADKGTEPTILTVQEAIGGGSYTTVKRFLDQWRAAAPKQRRPAAELPEGAVDRLMALGREFWGLLEDQAAAQVESIRTSARDEIAVIQAQLDDAERAIAKLEAEREQLEQRLAEGLAANAAQQRETQAQRERAIAAEAKAEQLEARLAECKADKEKAETLAAQQLERAAVLQGELAALRSTP